MTIRLGNVLFLCTGNSARSIMAEALFDGLGGPKYRGFSAGTQPKEAPHPVALSTLVAKGFDVDGLSSKSWEEFSRPAAPKIDLVISVCDNAADESCPIWPGNPRTIRWQHDDPAAFIGSEREVRAEFERVYEQLKKKIEALVRLDVADLDDAGLYETLDKIGEC